MLYTLMNVQYNQSHIGDFVVERREKLLAPSRGQSIPLRYMSGLESVYEEVLVYVFLMDHGPNLIYFYFTRIKLCCLSFSWYILMDIVLCQTTIPNIHLKQLSSFQKLMISIYWWRALAESLISTPLRIFGMSLKNMLEDMLSQRRKSSSYLVIGIQVFWKTVATVSFNKNFTFCSWNTTVPKY